jgi:hypothetical protein
MARCAAVACNPLGELSSMRILMESGSAFSFRFRGSMTALAWYCRVRAGKRKPRALMLLDRKERGLESLDGMADRAFASRFGFRKLTAVVIVVACRTLMQISAFEPLEIAAFMTLRACYSCMASL